MAGLRYDDYRVTLTPRADGGYDALGVGADGVAHRGTLRLPFDDAGLERAVLRIAGRAARGPATAPRDVGAAPRTDVNAEVLGAALAGALLAADVATGYDEARARAAAAGRGLRLTLSLGAAPALRSVPWELLYRPPTFLANQRQTPVVRHLDVDRLPDPPSVDGPVRILGVVADPPGIAPLDVAAERARVERAIAGVVELGRVELDWLSPVTPRRLREVLRDGTYHVLHYAGHGAITPAGDGVLHLADDVGGHAELGAAALADLLADQASLRLVVLNGSARTTLSDPFAGVATTLVQLGVPAVVAMQFAISDAAAILFAEELYANVVAGRAPIDVAVSAAREAICVEQDSVEWATPVLFLADPDVELFRFALQEPAADDAPAAGEAPVAAATPPPPVDDTPARRTHRRAGAIAGAVLLVTAVVVGLVVRRLTSDADAAAGTTAVVTAPTVTSGSAPVAEPLVEPMAFTGSIDAVGAERTHELTAAAGQHLYVRAGPDCNADLTYRVLDPSGELVSGLAHGACEDTDRFLAPVDGSYSLVVDAAGATGAYDLTVMPIRPDRVSAGTIGVPASGDIDGPGARHRVTFDLRAGDLVYVDGIQACGASTVKYDLVDGQGASLLGLAYPVCADAGRVLVTADGTYELLVSSDGGGTGAYSILLTPIRPDGGGPLAPGDVAAGDIRPAGAWDEWTFDAPAGSTVTLTPQAGCVDDLLFDVLAPGTGATEIGSAHRTCDVAGPFLVATDGPHTLRVFGVGPAVGSYSLLLDVT